MINAFALWNFIETPVSITAILIVTIFCVKLADKTLGKLASAASDSKRHINPAHYKFIKHFIAGLIYFIGFSIAVSMIPSLKTVALSVLASSGVLALIIGFASQQVFSNIISGIFLGIFRPFVIGNRIKLLKDTIYGVVEDITLRHTVIKTSENKRIIVPNTLINSESIENASWAGNKIRKYLDIPVSYDANLTKAYEIIAQVIEKHPLCLDIRTKQQKAANESPVEIRILKYIPSGILIRAAAWVDGDPEGYILASDCYKNIKNQFDQHNIHFPRCYCSAIE
jgi:small conductance mechanosensitive channel